MSEKKRESVFAPILAAKAEARARIADQGMTKADFERFTVEGQAKYLAELNWKADIAELEKTVVDKAIALYARQVFSPPITREEWVELRDKRTVELKAAVDALIAVREKK